MRRLAIFAQARMGSRRFPGKMLSPVDSVPLVAHVARYLKNIERLSEYGAYFVIQEAPENEVMRQWIEAMGAKVIRTENAEPLHRFLSAADILGMDDSDGVMRVCSGSPYLHPAFAEELVTAWRSEVGPRYYGWYLGDNPIIQTKAGICSEIITVGTMRKIQKSPDVKHNAEEIEHVTFGAYRRWPHDCHRLQFPEDLADIHGAIDTPKDAKERTDEYRAVMKRIDAVVKKRSEKAA